MKKRIEKHLKKRVQELNDIVEECADAIDALAQKPKAQVSTDDMEQPEVVIYGIPSSYAIAAFERWQEDARTQLINMLQKSDK